MPTKLTTVVQGSPRERIDAFRKTIPDGVGYSIEELSALPQIAISETHAGDIVRNHKWGVKQWSDTKHRSIWHLVNPKTLAQYANKTK